MRTKLLSIAFVIFCFTSVFAQKPIKYKDIGFKNQGSRTKTVEFEMPLLEYYFSYIPSSTYKMEDGKYVSSKSFYMLKFEVPNMLYRLFINDLKLKGKTEELRVSLPDTAAWGNNNQAFVDYYFQHPKYNSYPVVSVPRNGIQLFCEWMGEQVKQAKLKNWKNKKITFRLPTEVEWMIAASGGDTSAIYAWKGPYMRNGNGIWRGDFMANFRRVGDGDILRGEDGKLTVKLNTNTKYNSYFAKDYKDYFTSPVLSYWLNGYGLYNMTGNVREMVQEEGFTKGGGWIDPGGECMIDFRNTYQKEGYPCEGFRIVAVVE